MVSFLLNITLVIKENWMEKEPSSAVYLHLFSNQQTSGTRFVFFVTTLCVWKIPADVTANGLKLLHPELLSGGAGATAVVLHFILGCTI